MRKLTILLCIVLLLTLPRIAKAETAEVMPMPNTKTIALKVITLNLHSGINWYGQFDLDGIVKFIQENNPDLIAMQEVDWGWASQSNFVDIPKELATRLHMLYAFSVSLQRNEGFFGNLILSKFPIVQSWAEQLPGSLERRSFVMTQVMVDGVRVNFLTTHLGLSPEDRLAQMTAIQQFIAPINGPFIFTGDFNDNITDPAVAMVRSKYTDLGETDGRGTFRVKSGVIAPERMDYILGSPEVTLVNYQTINNYISDHLPVMAEVRITVPITQVTGEPMSY